MAADIINIATHGEVEELRESMKELSADITEGGDLMNERNELGKSAMDAAAMLGRAQMLQELQAHGADFNLSNNSGYTPLHQAASWGWIDCVKMLVEAGADLQKRTKYGERARECAARYHQQQCIEILDKSEAQLALRSLVQSFKEMVADPEKHMGKLSKEDRVFGNRTCDEKLNWIEANKETATVEEINTVKDQLQEFLSPIFSKLKEQSDLSVTSKQRSRSAKSPVPPQKS